MDALISQSTHYTQFIYEPNLIGEESPSELHIPADTRSAFPVISVQSPVSIQYRWQS